MVARNFVEIDNNILYPRLDIAGDKTGITGMELPLLNYAVYGVSKVFGYDSWYGRLINLLVSSIGIFFFFKLVRRYFDEKVAFYSAFILLVSIWFGYSRKIIPETFAMSLVIIGVYYGLKFLDGKSNPGRPVHALTYGVFVGLGTLSKISTGYILVIFLLPFFKKTIPVARKAAFAGVSAVFIFPTLIWYFYWVPFLVEKYEFWHFFMGESILVGGKAIFNNLLAVSEIFYFMALRYSGFIVFLGGLIYAVIKKKWLILKLFCIGFFSFLIIILKAGDRFYAHSYYLIPFVPIMALVAGYGLSRIKDARFAVLLLLAISVEGISNQLYDFNINKKQVGILTLEKDLDKFSSKEDLIIINSGGHPTPMYFSGRKGWILRNDELTDSEQVEALKAKNAKLVVVLKQAFGTFVDLNLPVLHDSEDYRIYKL